MRIEDASAGFALKFSFRGMLVALAVVQALIAVPLAQAQTLKVIYNFANVSDGRNPYAGLAMDQAGNLYGTANTGGNEGCNNLGCGTVFKLTNKASGWVFTPLYKFQSSNDGANPAARVVFGPDGSLYGTTSAGGNYNCKNGCGTVFNLKPPPRACTTALCPWTETILYQFTGATDGALPVGDLIFDQAGNLYGVAQKGGVGPCQGGCGVVFELTPSNGTWTETILYSFNGALSGCLPNGGVIFDQADNLYGVTGGCGALGQGTVYQLTPSGPGWTENTLFNFQSGYGRYPTGSLVFDIYGNLFGATQTSTFDEPWYPGTLYEIQRGSNNDWSLEYYYLLTTHEYPLAGLTADAAGTLYGDADGEDDEYSNFGVIYRLRPSGGGWNYWQLYSFLPQGVWAGPEGGKPYGPVVLDASGNIYGTCSTSATYNGTVWELTP
jgi:uncharacterized repeat protein (TIGR03803 family)